MAFITVKDMYKVKHPEEYAEKFPQPKKELVSAPDFSPSERARMETPEPKPVPNPDPDPEPEVEESDQEPVKASKKKRK